MSVKGSSPLTRGKPRALNGQIGNLGLIPAHAGKTWIRLVRWCTTRAHPRSRGENFVARCKCDSMLGSSPLTRGKPSPDTQTPARQGLIPAHAGKTST